MKSFEDMVEEIRDGRDLTPVDLVAVEAFVGVNRRLIEARARIESEGTIIEDSHGFPVSHPALAIEKQSSMELRGWVDKRPDLFGPAKRKPAAGGGFPGLKAVGS